MILDFSQEIIDLDVGVTNRDVADQLISGNMPQERSDLSFSVSASIDLQSWSSLQKTTISNNGFTDSVAVQDNFSVSDTAKRFLRLEVTFIPSATLRSSGK